MGLPPKPGGDAGFSGFQPFRARSPRKQANSNESPTIPRGEITLQCRTEAYPLGTPSACEATQGSIRILPSGRLDNGHKFGGLIYFAPPVRSPHPSALVRTAVGRYGSYSSSRRGHLVSQLTSIGMRQ